MRKFLNIILFLIIFGSIPTYLSADTATPQELINVKVEGKTETGIRVVVETTGKVKYHVMQVSNPSRLVIEMIDTIHKWDKKEMLIEGALIKRIRSGQFKTKPINITRIILDMASNDFSYDEVSTNNQVTISIGSGETVTENSKLSKGKTVKTKSKPKVSQKKTARKKSVKKSRRIKPNVPTDEHRKEIAKILKEKSARDLKRKKRARRGKSAQPYTTPGSVFGIAGEEIVDINLKEADILEVLRGFAIKHNKNIVPSSSVKGKITLRLNQVSFNNAFNMMMERMGLVAVQSSSNVIEIMKLSEMPTKRSTFKLKSRNASDISTTLSGLLTAEEKSGTSIAIDLGSNSLIVTANSEVLGKIGMLINQLDIRAPQIKIKARIIEVIASDNVTTGVTWASTLDLTGTIDEIRIAKDMGNFALDTNGNINIPKNALNTFTTGGNIDVSAIIDQHQLYSVLNFLANESEAKTVSEPTILTENNNAASIHVGRNLPVLTQTVTETGTTQSVTFVPEGVDLRVTPVVSPGSDLISLTISISVSEFVGYQADNPITSERSAETVVTIPTEKTVIIGGLIKEKISSANSGIPFLKDIPLIGYLFRNSSNIKERTELLVFLTPEILID